MRKSTGKPLKKAFRDYQGQFYPLYFYNRTTFHLLQSSNYHYTNLQSIRGLKPNQIYLVALAEGKNRKISPGVQFSIATDNDGYLYFNKNKDPIPTDRLQITTQGQTIFSNAMGSKNVTDPGAFITEGYFVPDYPGVPIPYQNGKWTSDPIPYTFYVTEWTTQNPPMLLQGNAHQVNFINGGILLP
jgi:hypothetical protein